MVLGQKDRPTPPRLFSGPDALPLIHFSNEVGYKAASLILQNMLLAVEVWTRYGGQDGMQNCAASS